MVIPGSRNCYMRCRPAALCDLLFSTSVSSCLNVVSRMDKFPNSNSFSPSFSLPRQQQRSSASSVTGPSGSTPFQAPQLHPVPVTMQYHARFDTRTMPAAEPSFVPQPYSPYTIRYEDADNISMSDYVYMTQTPHGQLDADLLPPFFGPTTFHRQVANPFPQLAGDAPGGLPGAPPTMESVVQAFDATKEIQCRWGGQCNVILDDLTPGGITRHLKDFHFDAHAVPWDNRNRGLCEWQGSRCTLKGPIYYYGFGKHVSVVHLHQGIARCDGCHRSFTRRDALGRHLKGSCRGARAG
ncbi:hypothetical protein AcW1_001684 [Taiwanofungus camphoratus]|nr:hypothetical protein AcV7_001542 [Antrodia cinnamomea]KAI0945469.1 hypothetical protein AcW1_001684 [Antrodia cinnamomea]